MGKADNGTVIVYVVMCINSSTATDRAASDSYHFTTT